MSGVEFKGAKLAFDGEYVTYEPNRAMRLIQGKQGFRIPISSVRYIEYRAPRLLSVGYLRVNTGEPPLDEPMEALRDQHSFHFEGSKYVAGVEAVKAELEQALAPRPAPAAAAPAAVDHTAALRSLAELRANGILTEEEFAAKKAEILARM